MLKSTFQTVARALRNEPVRLRLYTILTIVVGFQVSRGHVQLDDAHLYLELAAAVLGVEAARAKVTPLAKGSTQVNLHVDGAAVHKALLKLKRERGGNGLGLS